MKKINRILLKRSVIDTALGLFNDGFTVEEIEELTGISRETINKVYLSGGYDLYKNSKNYCDMWQKNMNKWNKYKLVNNL